MNRKTLFLVALLLPLFLSCDKDPLQESETNGVSLHMSLENGRNWNDGDLVYINGVNYPVSEISGTKAVAASVAASEEYYAAYDFGEGSVKGNVLSLNLPGTISYGDEPMKPMVAYSSSQNLPFKHLLGTVSLRISGAVGNEILTKITVMPVNPDFRISGPAEVAMDFAAAPVIVMSAEASNVLEINLGEGLDISSEKLVSFPLPPAMYDGGFKFILEDAEGKVMVSDHSVDTEVKRGGELELPAINYEPGDDAPIEMVFTMENDAFGEASVWNEHSSVNINGMPASIKSGAGTSEGTFGPVLKSESYVAVTPAKSYYSSSLNYAKVSIPSIQTYGAPLCEVNPMVAVAAGQTAELKYTAGVITVHVSGNNIISSLRLNSKSKAAYLSGKMDVEFSGDNFTAKLAPGSSTSVTLDCKEGVSTAGGKDFNFVVPAGTYSEGFDLIMVNNRNQMHSVQVGDVIVERNADVALDPVNWQPSVDDPGNLSAMGWANCYVVSAAGKYSFDTKYVDGSAISGISKVDWLWANSVKGNATSLVSEITYKEGTVSFKASAEEGNVLLAAFNASGEIVWSWHIWLTDEPQYINMQNKSDKDPSLGYFLMDRNLGATSAAQADGKETYGFFYQWGRKDPFYGGMKSELKEYSNDKGDTVIEKEPFRNAIAETVCNTKYPQAVWKAAEGTAEQGSVDFATKNPMFFLAGTVTSGDNNWLAKDDPFRSNYDQNYGPWAPFIKTNSDPCPVGYQVPRQGIWNDLEPKSRGKWTLDHSGFIYTSDSGESTWFPAQGIRMAHPSECGALSRLDAGKSNTIMIWTSEQQAVNPNCAAYSLNINTVLTNAQSSNDPWGNGLNVRCVKIYED